MEAEQPARTEGKSMTPAELDRLDRLMAEKCMGWQSDASQRYWHDGSGGCLSRNIDWNPTRDIKQAFQCAEKVGGLELKDRFWVDRGLNSQIFRWCAEIFGSVGLEDTPALAICLCIEKWLEEK